MRKLPIVLALLSALWAGPGRAVISWSGPACLYRTPAAGQQVLIACYPREATYWIELAGGDDWTRDPQAGDTYTIIRPGGGQEKTRLVSRVYLPAVGR
jgi:hypothetical protein